MESQKLWQQAHWHAERREWEQAKASFNALLAQHPDDPSVLLQLSYISSLAGNYRAARACALRASTARAIAPDVLKELLSRLRTFNEPEVFHRVVANLGPPGGIPIPLLLGCAAQLSYFNEQERALALLDEAKHADPDYPPTLMSRGQVLTYMARFDEAEQDLLRCQKRVPQAAQVYWLLSRLRTQTPGKNHVGQIRVQMERQGRNKSDIALLGYALHKELDDLKDFPGAMQALDLGSQAKRSTLDYRAGDTRKLVDDLIALPAPAETRINAGRDGDAARVPLFIVGMHRSGTTLLEQLLDGHGDVKGVGELYDFTSQMRYATDHHCRGVIDATVVARAGSVEFEAVGRGYLEKMEWRLGKERHFTDKLPSNFLNIGFICRALPQAKILHMVRDPVETCFSNLRELFSDANPYSYDQLELADYYKQYRRLMAHWHQAWPGRILDVDYAELTRDPEAMMRRVAAFCGLEYEAGMLDIAARKRGVATASAVQVRQGIAARESPKWAPYEAYLQPLIQALQTD
jgi:tetratricopeptide (TPR) repeat protein